MAAMQLPKADLVLAFCHRSTVDIFHVAVCLFRCRALLD